MIDTAGMMFPKPIRPEKKPKPLKSKTRLKSYSKPIPIELKRAVIQAKGNRCLMGFCPFCGGQAIVTEHDDGHHWPHRSRGGKDRIEDIWMMKRPCHMFLHDHPLIEKQVFGEILAAANQMLRKSG